MTLQYNGYSRNGTFQTGVGEVVRLWLAHEVAPTGVRLRRDQLVSEGFLPSATLSGSNDIEIEGVTYTANATYDQALCAQKNLDNLIAKFAMHANPTSVWCSDGIATTTSPTSDTTTGLIGGADKMGTEMAESAGLIWEVELSFEQKGTFNNASSTASFVRGAASLGSESDNFGSSVADIHELVEGTAMYVTGPKSAGGDSENAVDADTTAAFVNGVNYATNVSGAFAGNVGDLLYVVSNGNAAQATSQTVVVEVVVQPDAE